MYCKSNFDNEVADGGHSATSGCAVQICSAPMNITGVGVNSINYEFQFDRCPVCNHPSAVREFNIGNVTGVL